ncbi:MAG: hypothetical protein CMI73_02465 [Candidatus Pelagibacter sp.]|nr:hypothetical protein [Candidatus Pelagibacter sp.]OUV87578.1 MAG: hypothetical protein CBC96_01865 [Pelagibacteraceae bacterium TMED136]|tara:strand:- start:222 stop:464 length:243 start_codon:yes stop_codon:yes gene_type:complete
MFRLLITLTLLCFASVKSHAGSCPVLIQRIDQTLSASKQISKEQFIEIKQLRDQGKKAHNSGEHKESEDLLNQALKILES